ncbi:Nif3-like dinuclear metal center hexameric protein [Aurantibacillus circumpalustris]|uniref:Nif3-like dinuclear metal center hexameric protein n=1 Tax=Aurantibacillus circumpalustris TaxID=3036359 RepID=UPI00295B9496|nr:Nif3-like dinuclear metal center hexameric protein [Aurantibacillus circumpalustris]
MTVGEIIDALEIFAPLSYQEDYDNCGLLTGNRHEQATGALLTLDCTEEIVDEAIAKKCNLIIAHHPIIFSGLKKITGSTYIERTIIKAIKNDIAIYACHTNLDNVRLGVNNKIAEKLGLLNVKILAPKKNLLKKIVSFVPASHHELVLRALFAAGAGNIGNYDQCSFNLEGNGTFRGNEQSKPFIGKANELSKEKEIRIETLFESANQTKIISALLGSHPYEEIAYDIYTLDNKHALIGSGMIGEFEQPLKEIDFLNHVKKVFQVPTIKHTHLLQKSIKKVAICGGSGRFLLKNAISSGADAYITSDFKYHEYFDAEKTLLLVDTGHYESEQFTPEIFYDIIQKKFTTFAIHLSKINTNPINYF